ncbi:DUF3857 domain-containing protein [Chitinophaga sp. MM2321]|uniref:DUF3857 domain-containing protein n=1 Tax=Chitinophaga sp. MM2321 TaxID=3137178 RepID=UPI0032D59479
MVKLLQLVACLLLAMSCAPVFAGGPVYPVNTIPDSLKKDAHLVKRFEEFTLNIVDLQKVRINHHYILTVLDEEGAKYTQLQERYSKQIEVRSISGALYDASGKLMTRLKQSSIQDIGQQRDGSLMTDTRYKVHQFSNSVYPYTVEYEVEQQFNYSYSLPFWIAQDYRDGAVEQARFIVNAPADYKLRYHTFSNIGEPVITTEKERKLYKWEVHNIPVGRREVFSESWYRLTPGVELAPSNFEWGRYKGSMNTWEDFGQFGYQLNEGRDVLPDAMKQKVSELVAGLSTKEEKIRVLYRYLQQNYRYISIQLGIGGLQTFDAKTVAANGYGDCKALSNYMMAMLKEAGIKSNCVWVKAGEGDIRLDESFPHDGFNHVILCVPGVKDTTWLECTDNTLPAGYLSGFTAGRPVLILDEKGPQLIHTPASNMDMNQQRRSIHAVLDEKGNMKVDAVTTRTGLEQDDLHSRLHQLSKEQQLERLRSSLNIASYDVTGYECTEAETANPSIEEHMQLACNNYATVTGKRIFLTPNMLNRSIPKLEPDEDRISDIQLNYEYRHVDSVSITIPQGYKAEALPAPVMISGKFGNYVATTAVNGNTVTYIRTIQHKSGIFPAADFPELVTFYNGIFRADRSRVVLVKDQD